MKIFRTSLDKALEQLDQSLKVVSLGARGSNRDLRVCDLVYLKGSVRLFTGCVTGKESLIFWGGMRTLLHGLTNTFKMKNE